MCINFACSSNFKLSIDSYSYISVQVNLNLQLNDELKELMQCGLARKPIMRQHNFQNNRSQAG